jgi:GNAT superfamily N-acetyltransferase
MPHNISGEYATSRLTIGPGQLDENTIQQLLDFWKHIFLFDYEPFRRILEGKEFTDNLDVLYFAGRGEKIVGTCHLTVSLTHPELGGLGEVGTIPEFRGIGIASTLCAMAIDDFRIAGGKALFLGTDNPVAALIYSRLGWQKLDGTNVMVHLTKGESPEEFLAGNFSNSGTIKVKAGTPADRIQIIPLIVTPHDWQVMDANLNIFSTRYVVQRSCMGLYPRYESLCSDGRGAWFAARNDQEQTVGLSTVRFDGSEKCLVDGFVLSKYAGSWEILMQASLSWASAQNIRTCRAKISLEDEEKMSLFEASGFRKEGKGATFNLGGREVASIYVEIST